jgi:hypothetical protein
MTPVGALRSSLAGAVSVVVLLAMLACDVRSNSVRNSRLGLKPMTRGSSILSEIRQSTRRTARFIVKLPDAPNTAHPK